VTSLAALCTWTDPLQAILTYIYCRVNFLLTRFISFNLARHRGKSNTHLHILSMHVPGSLIQLKHWMTRGMNTTSHEMFISLFWNTHCESIIIGFMLMTFITCIEISAPFSLEVTANNFDIQEWPYTSFLGSRHKTTKKEKCLWNNRYRLQKKPGVWFYLTRNFSIAL